MSAIAEILALVNGNPNKTLDELILGEKTFVATSDTTLKVLGSTRPITSSAIPVGKFSFIPKLSGTINIRITSPIVTGHYGTRPINLIVFENGVQISSYTFEQSTDEQTIYLHSINILKDAKYSFDIQQTSGGLADYSEAKLEICAIVVDSNYYE